MAIHDLSTWRHQHAFDRGNRAGERRTWIVVALTAAAMVGEIVTGWLTHSMALLADGWHMATHVVALSVAGVAYWLARRGSSDDRFAFGTWKIEVLGAFTSALLLMVVALAMVVESLHRLLDPEQIQFEAALTVAAIGLGVNLLSAWVLHGGSAQGHDYHGHGHHGHDHPDHTADAAHAHAGHGHERHDQKPLARWMRRWSPRARRHPGRRRRRDRRPARMARGTRQLRRGGHRGRPPAPDPRRLPLAARRFPALAHVSVEVNRCAHRDCP